MKHQPKERGILFSGPLVRAILAGDKTQTRRLVKPQPPADTVDHCFIAFSTEKKRAGTWQPVGVQYASISQPALTSDYHTGDSYRCPYGLPGDRLYVRETWQRCTGCWTGEPNCVAFRADPEHANAASHKWKPSIHMPRRYSRALLGVIDIRVDRLQNITTGDIVAEGLRTTLRGNDAVVDLREQWVELWDRINGHREGASWKCNPWVWVVEFSKVEAN